MIVGFVGLHGQGKTMLGVDHALALAWRRGAVLVSNIKIVPPASRPVLVHQLAIGEDGFSVDELEEVLEAARDAGLGLVLFLDEVSILMPARFWQNFPVRLMYVLSQSRHLRCDVVYTAQDVDDVDTFLRRHTLWVWRVRAIPSPSIERQERGKRPWFFVTSQWPAHAVGSKDRKISGPHFIRYRRSRETVYDTDELVRPPERLLARGRRGAASGRAVSGA